FHHPKSDIVIDHFASLIYAIPVAAPFPEALPGFLWLIFSWFYAEFFAAEECSIPVVLIDPKAMRCGLNSPDAAVEFS
ncbi:MAG: hypothetical protein ACK48U_05490, partial [Planctomyces sp.]